MSTPYVSVGSQIHDRCDRNMTDVTDPFTPFPHSAGELRDWEPPRHCRTANGTRTGRANNSAFRVGCMTRAAHDLRLQATARLLFD